MNLKSYHEWVACITVDCKVELTASYIDARLKALRNPKDKHTKRYVELYGEQHLNSVIGWFERAREEQQA